MYFLSIFVKDFPLLTNSSPLLVLCLIFTPSRFIVGLVHLRPDFQKVRRTLNSKKANLIKPNVSLRTNWKSVSRMFFSNYWYTPSSDYFWSHRPPSPWQCWLFRKGEMRIYGLFLPVGAAFFFWPFIMSCFAQMNSPVCSQMWTSTSIKFCLTFIF